jgi:hypothetical protein
MQRSERLQLIGRLLMTIATLAYGVIPLFVDLSQTHVLHPDWTPHARMHMVWLLGTNSSLALVALCSLWLYRTNTALGTHLAGVLGLCVYGGFLLSAATLDLYAGALSDQDGVPPVLGMDANVVVFSQGLLMLLAGWILTGRRST